jgi:hypothetical protein
VESASVAAPEPVPGSGSAAGDKGLKAGALGYLSNLVIGVASTAPGYSLAATLGFVVAVKGVGVHAPAVMLVSFVPMLLIAAAYNYMNKADPDCGTSFTWVTKAMGPRFGWLTGWAIVAADIVVMATLAYIAGVYTFLLFGWQEGADSLLAVSIAAVVWIVVMTWICYVGIELSAKIQYGLLTMEIFALGLFAIVARWVWMERRDIAPQKGLSMVLTPAELLIRVRGGILRTRWPELASASVAEKRAWSVLEGTHEARKLVISRRGASPSTYEEPYLGLPVEVAQILVEAYAAGRLPSAEREDDDEA